MKEKIEAEQFQKKLCSLNKDIASLKEQQDKLKKKEEMIAKTLAEKTEKRNSLIISYIAEPLGNKEVDFRQAKYLRVQLEKGTFQMNEVGAIHSERQEEILEDNI